MYDWSSLLWSSRLQKRILQIAWSMWQHRNNILHSDGKTIHQYETDLIDQEIVTEWSQKYTLPAQYAHLFQGNLQQLLTLEIQRKRRWLANVGSAQETRQQPRTDRNEHVVIDFERWKTSNL